MFGELEKCSTVTVHLCIFFFYYYLFHSRLQYFCCYLSVSRHVNEDLTLEFEQLVSKLKHFSSKWAQKRQNDIIIFSKAHNKTLTNKIMFFKIRHFKMNIGRTWWCNFLNNINVLGDASKKRKLDFLKQEFNC